MMGKVAGQESIRRLVNQKVSGSDEERVVGACRRDGEGKAGGWKCEIENDDDNVARCCASSEPSVQVFHHRQAMLVQARQLVQGAVDLNQRSCSRLDHEWLV